MNQSTRRGFLALTGTGVAAVAVAPTAVAAASRSSSGAGAVGNPGAPLVAYVQDAAAGEVAVMVGERQVVVHDRALVARLAKHLKS